MPEEEEQQQEHPHLDEEEEFGADVEVIRQRRIELGPDWDAEVALDTTEVRIEDVDLWRPQPAWLITSQFLEEDLGRVRSGKEADVRLVRRTSGDRECLLAYKKFRPRAQRAFRREEEYRKGQRLGDDRVDRAVKRRTRYGRSVLEYAWAYRELPLMRTAWDAGANVPYPVEETPDGLLMQYLGEQDEPAPRLSDVRLDADDARDVYEDIVGSMRRMLDVCLVHADLSAYNVLWFDDRPWLIDFPQALDVAKSPHGVEFLRRDCENVCTYFRRQGVDCDGRALFDELLRGAPFG